MSWEDRAFDRYSARLEADDEYVAWCEDVGRDPDDPDSARAFDAHCEALAEDAAISAYEDRMSW